MAVLLSTETVRQHDRLDYWRDAVCASYVPLECSSPNPKNFSGAIELHRMSKVSASYVTGSKQVVRRRKRDIGAAGDASFLISLQLNQTGVLEQSDRHAVLRPGDFGLYSSIDPYALTLPEGFRQLVLQVPRDDMLRRLPNADRLTGISVSGASEIGSLVNDGITRLISSIDTTNDLMMQCLQDTIVDLVATGLASLGQTKFDLSRPEQLVLMRAHAFLIAHLADPELSRDVLAKAMGLSVRRLSEIFQIEGNSIATTIREMRMRHIAADLIDPRYARVSISELAMKWGIINLQSFSRMFQSHFGISPRAYREGEK